MSDDEANDAMLQAMGFSSFGTSQRPTKEPKEKASGEVSASGANSAPIAKRAKTNTTSKLAALSSSPPTFSPVPIANKTRSAISAITAKAPMFTPASILPPPTPPGVLMPSTSLHQDRYGSPTEVPQLSPSSFARIPGPLAHTDSTTGISPPGVPQLSPNSFTRAAGLPIYTNPQSGISLTSQELNELKRGKRNVRGDLVFFQPSFVDEDPWKRSRGMVGL